MPRQKVQNTLNPLLAKAFPSFFPIYGSPLNGGLITFSTFDMIWTPTKKGAYARKEASWRRMLVQQPPIFEFAFFAITSSREFFSYFQHDIMPKQNQSLSTHAGLTMQGLFEWVISNISLKSKTRNRIYWPQHTPISIAPDWCLELAEAIRRSNERSNIVILSIRSIGRRSSPRAKSSEEVLRDEIRDLEEIPPPTCWKPYRLMPGSFPACDWRYPEIPTYSTKQPEGTHPPNPCYFDEICVETKVSMRV